MSEHTQRSRVKNSDSACEADHMTVLLAAAEEAAKGLLPIKGGHCTIGSSAEEIERCVWQWAGTAANVLPGVFRSWIEKEHPAHNVELSPYAMSQHPVTVRQFNLFLTTTGYAVVGTLRSSTADDHPICGVSLEDARAYITWLNSEGLREFRLPTEAEWEWAARGPDRREFPWGNEFHASACNTREAEIGGTTPVWRYAQYSSAFGLVDMAGNVEEFTASSYEPYVGGRVIADDSYVTHGQNYTILRGGSFLLGGDTARCARRHGLGRPSAERAIGFRLASGL
jgi:toxoflavin biosynthesis protein ToxD